jgi:hypothetical protein
LRPAFPVVALAVGLALATPFLSGCGDEGGAPVAFARLAPEPLADLSITAKPGDVRAMFFADGRGTYFYDAAIGEQSDAAMGFHAGGFRMLDGWRWWFPGDSVGLGPGERTGAIVRPDFAARSYVEPDTTGIVPRLVRRFRGPAPKRLTEVITLADGALLVSIPDSLGITELFPSFSDRAADGYTTQVVGTALAIARSNYMAPRANDPRPVWVALAASNGIASTARVDLITRVPGAFGVRDRSAAPGSVRFPTPGAVAFATGETAEEAAAAAERALAARDAALEGRQRRMLTALDGPTLRTEDADFNRAYAWARVTLEQLVVEDSAGVDLSAGLPGAAAQPGWNTMQAFEGAFLVTGQWERAAQMLRQYARYQRFDRRIDIFGRAPSRFVGGRPRYDTADAQAMLVGALGDYLRYTGNENLVLGERRLFWTNPVYVQRGYDDPGQHRTPSGLIRSGPNQTWLQTPTGRQEAEDRGPEAIEVQARYRENLATMERLARIMGVRRQAEAYRDTARVFDRRVQRAFLVDEGGTPRLADARGADRRPSPVMRPSALWAMRSFRFEPETERQLLRRFAETMVYPHGVGSRPQGDTTFYPYLQDPEFFEAGQARYDGPVWTAFSGPLISLLVRNGAPDRAYEQHVNLQRMVLERGMIGGIAENVDAHPRGAPPPDPDAPEEDRRRSAPDPQEPAVGGAPVQPFTLAEFIRTAYQDFAGVQYLNGNDVVLEPHLPASWGTTVATFRMGNGRVRATMRQRGGELQVSVVPQGQLPRDARLRIRAHGREHRLALTRQAEGGPAPADSVAFSLTADRSTLNGEAVQPDSTWRVPDPTFWEGFTWAQPEIPEEYAVMRRVQEQRQLSPDQIARVNPNAVPILARSDPEGDDWGTTATYTYPEGVPARVLDATYLEISEDRDAYYFRIELAAMADPSEFGGQPTILALTFDTEEGGQRVVGRGADYRFPPANGYEYVVFIADGIRVEDHRGRVLAEFAQLGENLLDLDRAALQFALPKFVLPNLPRNALVTLLTGAHDGQGGFRPVREVATERQGGGRLNPRDPNVYDVISARIGA